MWKENKDNAAIKGTKTLLPRLIIEKKKSLLMKVTPCKTYLVRVETLPRSFVHFGINSSFQILSAPFGQLWLKMRPVVCACA